ncbi:rhodanese-like domain-containing protein [Wenzhouxiangella limi]|uniref:Rhodanese-like domain-containing protein n=1 Tax=Wenzhouxiangella limi TaxID=2707351 RepID=A0A845VBE8_9GAMM|nr:rhodanese-like domain-containing protein [Wenzhouxiangella limi]
MSRKSWRIVALLGATVALTTACGQSGDPMQYDVERVGSAIARGEAQISIPELSRRVVEDQGDFRLVDIRDAAAFEAFHIPGAVNVGAMEIVRPEKAEEVAGGRQIVLYGETGIAASQASAVLQMAGINALALAGDFDDWFAYTSDPAVELAGVSDPLGDSERQAFVEFFHGDSAEAPDGYSPGVTPAGGGASAALGMSAPSAEPAESAPASASDPHGLGLHLGVGVDIERPELAVVEEEETAEEEPRRLIIGEGC